MSAREPLPYPHPRKKFDRGFTSACTQPEVTGGRLSVSMQCPGCVALSMAAALKNPSRTAKNTVTGERERIVDTLRESLDDFDPTRVLFERALAERGMA